MKKNLQELAKTVAQVAKTLVKEGKFLNKNPEVRMNICMKCECFHNRRCSRDLCKEDKARGIKGGCGCYLDAKTKLEAATCPKGKW